MRKAHSFKRYLAALAAAATIPLVALWAYTASSHYGFRQDTAMRSVHQVAQLTAANARLIIGDTRIMLETLAADSMVRSMRPSDCQAFFSAASAAAPLYRGFSLSNTDGTMVCTSPPSDVRSVSEREWFQEVSSSGSFTVSRPTVGLVTGEWISVFSVPVNDPNGNRLGYLTASLSVQRFQQILAAQSLPPEAITTIAYTDGTLVARSRDPEQWVGRSVPIAQPEQMDEDARESIVPSAEGELYLWAWEDLPEADWRIFSGLPANMVARQSMPGLTLGIVIGTLLLISVLLLAYAIYGIVNKRIGQLVEGARRAGLDASPLDMTGLTEFDEVARQFNETLLERRKAETALGAANQLYQSVLENAALGILVARADGTIVEANVSLAELLGTGEVEQLIGRNYSEFFADSEEWHRVGEALRVEAGRYACDTTWARLEGETFPVRLNISRIELQEMGDAGSLVLAGDLSSHQQLEAQLRQSQKLEAVGRLAGGIAHDFNNRLTVILNCAELLENSEHEENGGERDQVISAIIESATRSADLTRQLLMFSRKQVMMPQTVDLNQLLVDFQGILRRGIEEDVVIETSVASTPYPVFVDRGQLEQVILNLATNAGDAMPGGGKLTLSSRIDEVRANSTHVYPDAQLGSHVVLSVSDTGVGMNETTKANLFEPFFTTKAVGKGTGLGLSTVYGIVRQSNGHMRVFSEPGVGTCFEVWLPLSDAADLEGQTEVIATAPSEPTEGCTLLLVEDDPAVRALIPRMLQKAGYHVLVAEDGPAALALARKHEGHIDALVTDWVMPQMRGPELARRLCAERPSVRVLYISGYTDEQLGDERLQVEPMELLTKPFTTDDLVARLEALLKGA